VDGRGDEQRRYGPEAAMVSSVRCRTELTMKTVLAVDQVLLNLGRNFIRDANPHHVQAVDPVEIISVTRIDR
jgi:hypothetical protein